MKETKNGILLSFEEYTRLTQAPYHYKIEKVSKDISGETLTITGKASGITQLINDINILRRITW